MGIVISAPQVQGEIAAYVSPASGRLITSRAERRADLAATGSRPWEGYQSEAREAARRRAEADAKLDKALEEGARKAFHELPRDKRRILESGA